MRALIEAICTGTARPFNGAELSAIAKREREGPVQILPEGFAPDEQADRRNHGGPEKAVHLYPLSHRDFWREWLRENAPGEAHAMSLLQKPGAFGSNLAVLGIDEEAVYIGDRFALGSAVVEVSQPRQPCWKIDHRFGVKGMTKTVVKTGRCGWYFRVIETGEVSAGDDLVRIKQGNRRFSVARVFSALNLGQATGEDLAEIADLDCLAPEARKRALKRAQKS